jgi:hypothetical protein
MNQMWPSTTLHQEKIDDTEDFDKDEEEELP